MVGYDRWGRLIQGFPDYWYMDLGTPNDYEIRRAVAAVEALADEVDDVELGENKVSALPRRSPGGPDEFRTAEPLHVHGGFDPERAMALLRSWREGTQEEIAAQRDAGDAILEGLRHEPIRFREVRLDE